MPFRCKCGRTFEKVDTFGTHTSGCASFHGRRVSNAGNYETKPERPSLQNIQTTTATTPTANTSFWSGFLSSSSLTSPQNKSPPGPTPPVSPMAESPSSASSSQKGFMLPTALSIQNTFEGVRRRSLYNENTNT